MIDLLVAAALLPSAAQSTAPAAAAVIQPPLDTPQERQALRKLTICVAQLRPQWARTMLSYPYLSDDQASIAAEMVSGRDNCLGKHEVAVAFRTSSVVGFAAEHLVQAEMVKVDPKRIGNALNSVAPKNASEDFGLCLAARDPSEALDLAYSDPGSGREASAAGQVALGLSYCSKPGESLKVDVQALRALVATALYRGVTAAVDAASNRAAH
jgi:hypothetical protein